MNKDCIRNDFNTDASSKNGCFEYDLINDCKIFLRPYLKKTELKNLKKQVNDALETLIPKLEKLQGLTRK